MMIAPSEADLKASMSYKLRKEAFVSNLNGSNITDINLVTLAASSAILLWTALHKNGVLEGLPAAVKHIVDFLLSVCSILFAFTVYSSTPIFLNLVFLTPALLLLLPLRPASLTSRRRQKEKSKKPDEITTGVNSMVATSMKGAKHRVQSLEPGRLLTRPMLTMYRASMLVATALAILAVDFPIFPRRFAKAETWGVSLMDLGVGSFVFSAGVVSARSILSEQASETQGIEILINVGSRIFKSLRTAVPLFVLGMIRLISVKNLDYAEHVSEYGVHWNFFFTLALLNPFVELVDCLLALSASVMGTNRAASAHRLVHGRNTYRSIRYDVAALLISLAYESLLNRTRLLSFILISPRTPESNLLEKNREGIFSFIGYLAVFLAGRSTGVLVCQFQSFSGSSMGVRKTKELALGTEVIAINLERRKVILPALATRVMAYFIMYQISTSVYTYSLQVSRRLANLPYVLWVVAFNDAQILLFGLVEWAGPKFSYFTNTESNPDVVEVKEITSPLLRAFNNNGLALFLIANLLTGIVNMTMNTLDADGAVSMAVLTTYAGLLAGFALIIDSYGIKIKL